LIRVIGVKSKEESSNLQKSKEVLEEIAKILSVKKNSEDYNLLMDLAAISFIPLDLIDEKSIVDKLPVFFRTLRGNPPTKEELKELIKNNKRRVN